MMTPEEHTKHAKQVVTFNVNESQQSKIRLYLALVLAFIYIKRRIFIAGKQLKSMSNNSGGSSLGAAGAGEGVPAGSLAGSSSDRGPRRRGGHCRGRVPPRGTAGPTRPPQKPIIRKFVGKEESLGDEYVYQLTSGNEASDQYARTTEEIVRYTSTKFKRGGDVERSLTNGSKLIVPMPTAPTGADAPDHIVQGWKMKVSLVLQRDALLDSNLESTYGLITGQCSESILEKVKAQDSYTDVHRDRDPIRLLGIIKAVMIQYDSKKYRAMAILQVINPQFVSQTRGMTDSEYLEKFRTKLSVLESAGGDILSHPGMIEDEYRAAGTTVHGATNAQRAAAAATGKGRIAAALFLVKSDQTRYGRLVQELANDFNKNRDCYPTSLTEAYELMLHDVRDQDNRPHPQGNAGMAFSTVTQPKGRHNGGEGDVCHRYGLTTESTARRHVSPVQPNRSLRGQVPRAHRT
jgi:hypothetical protein